MIDTERDVVVSDRCDCGQDPDGIWVYWTTCPIHEGKSAAQWRTAYIELDREYVRLQARLKAALDVKQVAQ